jgi:hypothetical protein
MGFEVRMKHALPVWKVLPLLQVASPRSGNPVKEVRRSGAADNVGEDCS